MKKPASSRPAKHQRPTPNLGRIIATNSDGDLRPLNEHAAGIDIGAERHYVAVPPAADAHPVREFSVFTKDLYAMADWLQQCGITSVAMESTGVYWMPL